MTIFTLRDDVENVNFFDGTNYKLKEDSLVLSFPELKEISNEDSYFAGRDLVRMSYGPRSIEFEFYALGSNIKTLSDNISKVQRILSRAINNTYLKGGYFGALNGSAMQDHITYGSGTTTGDHGVILEIRRGSDTEVFTLEATNTSSGAVVPSFTTRVISGQIEAIEKGFAAAMQMADGKYARLCRCKITAEPFFVGPSRILTSISDGNGYYSGEQINHQQSGPFVALKPNRAFIEKNAVPGDGDALTRIVTNMQSATGLIIARDAGVSILNCPGSPTAIVGSGKNDFYVFGQYRSNNIHKFRVKVVGTGTPNTFQFAKEGNDNTFDYAGAVTQNMVANQPIKLGSDEVYIVWLSTTGHTLNNEWEFDSHQAYFAGGSNVDFNNAANLGYAETGGAFYSRTVNIPPGCRGKYKFIAQIETPVLLEYRMRVQFRGYGVSGFAVTEPQYYEWTGLYAGGTYDFGIIDLTSISAPFMSHPYSFMQMIVTVYGRTTQSINATANVRVVSAYLIPAGDEYAYMQAGWKYDGSGYEVYSNYDPTNPYIAEESANYFNNGGNNATAKMTVGLDATYSGNIITLVPGIEQTILFVPLLGTTSDWRRHILAPSGKTGNTYIAIRPRYLHLPG